VLAIPKDAVQTTPGFYRWTDKDGKVWTYRRTPFGVTRWPPIRWICGRDAVDKHNAAAGRTTAVEAGDSIRFEQATPFGKRTWVRKKTELNETERKIWDLQQKNKHGQPYCGKGVSGEIQQSLRLKKAGLWGGQSCPQPAFSRLLAAQKGCCGQVCGIASGLETMWHWAFSLPELVGGSRSGGMLRSGCGLGAISPARFPSTESPGRAARAIHRRRRPARGDPALATPAASCWRTCRCRN
jgi:hypothetical protein